MSNVIAVTEELKDAAGIIVWWSMSGLVELDDLREAAEVEGIDSKHLPAPPTPLTALSRAASASLEHQRQLLRPLRRRGEWEIVEETVVQDEVTGREKTQHERLVSGWVAKNDTGAVYPEVVPLPERAVPLAEKIRQNYRVYKHVLTTTDISNWLIWYAEHVASAVSLRDRGGFYFIPRDQVATWKQIERAVRACSSHKLYEIPAMRTQEAVEAILSAVRKEAEQAFETVESYLAKGIISTKGVNAYTRQAEEVQAKVARYAELLGIALPDLSERAEQLKGALQAAKIDMETVSDGAQ